MFNFLNMNHTTSQLCFWNISNKISIKQQMEYYCLEFLNRCTSVFGIMILLHLENVYSQFFSCCFGPIL